MDKLTVSGLAIEVRAMRNHQVNYFELIGKAKKSKLPADFAAANAELRASKKLEALVDGLVRGILALEGGKND